MLNCNIKSYVYSIIFSQTINIMFKQFYHHIIYNNTHTSQLYHFQLLLIIQDTLSNLSHQQRSQIDYKVITITGIASYDSCANFSMQCNAYYILARYLKIPPSSLIVVEEEEVVMYY